MIAFIILSFSSKGIKNVDSLLHVIATSVNDSSVSDAYLQLSLIHSLNNPKLALSYINLSIDKFNKFSSDFQYNRFLKKGEIFRLLGEIDSCLHYINMVYAQGMKNNKFLTVGECYSEYGLVNIAQGNSQKAIEQFMKHLAIIKKYKYKKELSGIYNNIGIAYANRGDWDMANEYFLKALKDDQTYLRDMNLGNDYNNLGVVFLIRYGLDSLKKNNNLDSARKYLNKGLFHRYKIHDSIGIAGSLNNLSLIENETGNFKLALSLADSAFKIASLNGYKKIQVEIYDSYDQIYSKMGNFKMAYAFLNKKNKLNIAFEKEQLNNNIQQLESDIQLEQKQKQLLEKDLKLTRSENQKQKQFGFIVLAVVLIIALMIFLFYFFKNNRTLSERNSLISEQKNVIEEKHKDITDSITYAHRIQSSLIPTQLELNKKCPKLAILFQPRDIVSGDFYWYSKINDVNIFVLADCTGHGVPGAFMSFIGINQLNTIVNEKGIVSPQQILNELKKGVVSSLNSNQDNTEKKDGMDVALISFNEHELFFSGANQSVLIIRESQLIELKGNKQPIGLSENNESFKEVKFNFQKGDRVVLYSDGIVDQFGGELGKKLKTRHFKAWLVETSYLSLQEQKEAITEKLNLYKENYDQTDDITLAIIEI
ncbi:MAG: SpoIIE family protein phosphatase [Burkholderiales bacterium]|nr:SpoIIE family protein phosphatase [Bacteroidia bacterium]